MFRASSVNDARRMQRESENEEFEWSDYHYKKFATIELEERINFNLKKRRGLKRVVSDIGPDVNSDLEKLDPKTVTYRNKRNTRLCCCCYELPRKIVSYYYNGIRLIERYCDTHAKVFVTGPKLRNFRWSFALVADRIS